VCLIRFFELQKYGEIIVAISFFIALLCSSVLLEFALGSPLPARSLLSLPMVLAISWFVIYELIPSHLSMHFLYGISLIFLIIQTQSMNSIFYGNDLRFQNDTFMARSIMNSIEMKGFNYHKEQIVFVGHTEDDKNRYVSANTSGGISFFSDASQPYRMTYFLNSLGYQVETPSSVEYKTAKDASVNSPLWPAPDSIVHTKGVIIVKLS
jgi:hypothetical protein